MKIIIVIILISFLKTILSASVVDHQKFCFPSPRARIVAGTLATFSGSNLYVSDADVYFLNTVSASVKYFITNGTDFIGFSNTSMEMRAVRRIAYHLEDLPCDNIITQVANSIVTIGKGVNCFNVPLDASFRVPITNCTLIFDANLGTNDDNFIMRGPDGRIMIFDSIKWEWKNGASPCNLKWYGRSTLSNFLTISDNTTLYGDFISLSGVSQQLKSTKSLKFYGSVFTVASFQNRGNLTVIRNCPSSPWIECEDQTYRYLTWGSNDVISDVLYSTKQILDNPTSAYIVNNTINIHGGSFAHEFEPLPNITTYNIDGSIYLGAENENLTNVFEQRKDIYDIIVKKTCDYEIFVASEIQTFYNGTTCVNSMDLVTTVIFDANGDSNALFYIIIISNSWSPANGFATQLINETSRHNIHWVVMGALIIKNSYPIRVYFDGHLNVYNLTLSTVTTSANLANSLELDRYLTINGSIHAKWSIFEAITNLNVYPSGLLLGDIELPPPPNTICILLNGTCSEGFHSNVTCDDEGAIFYSNQLCVDYFETILFNRPNSSCVLVDGTCIDGVRQNVTCDDEGSTFYFDQTCAQYVPPVYVQSSCTLVNGTCFSGLNVSCPIDGIYVENEICSDVVIIPLVDTYCLYMNGTCEQVLLGNVSCNVLVATFGYNATCPIISSSTGLSIGVISLIVVYGTLFSLGIILILYFIFQHSQSFTNVGSNNSYNSNRLKKTDGSIIFKKAQVV